MTVRLQFYKCDICGNIAQILHEGEGNLVCCGQEMNLLEENLMKLWLKSMYLNSLVTEN